MNFSAYIFSIWAEGRPISKHLNEELYKKKNVHGTEFEIDFMLMNLYTNIKIFR